MLDIWDIIYCRDILILMDVGYLGYYILQGYLDIDLMGVFSRWAI